MEIKTIVNGKLATNSYLIYCKATRQAAVIDPAEGVSQIMTEVNKLGLNLGLIINTHGHADHISGNKKLVEEYGCQIAISSQDAPMLTEIDDNFAIYLGLDGQQPEPDRLLAEGDIIQIGEIKLSVIATPGHTEGGIALYDNDQGVLFSGDTLFKKSMGRVDLPGGNLDKIRASLKKLCRLPGKTIVYPGHGPSTTIDYEKEQNPYCQHGGL